MPNVKALEIWTAQTLCDVGILLSIVSLLLHLGRPYFERILGRLMLRVAADVWWLLYVVLRDGTLFGAVLLGFWGLNLDLMADIKIGLPFVPFARSHWQRHWSSRYSATARTSTAPTA